MEATNPLAQQSKAAAKAAAATKKGGSERVEVKHNPMAQARARAAEEKAAKRKLEREQALAASEKAAAAALEAAAEAVLKKSRAEEQKAAEDAESTAESQAAAAAAEEASRAAEEAAQAAARAADEAAEAASLATAAAAAGDALAAARAAAEAKAEAEEEEAAASLETSHAADGSVAVDVAGEGAGDGKGAGWVRNMFKRLEKSGRNLVMPTVAKSADNIGVRFFGNARFVKTDAAIQRHEEENKRTRLAALLARGYVEKTSRSTGKPYYYEPSTGKTLWSLPELDLIPERSSAEPKEAEVVPKGSVLSTLRRLGASFRGAGGSPSAQQRESEAAQTKAAAAEAARTEELARTLAAAAAAAAQTSAAAAAAELPPGWASRVSKSTGKTMYFCTASGETAWEVDSIPGMAELKAQRAAQGAAEAQAARRAGGVTLPMGWASRISKSTGATLYFNAETGENAWTVETIPGYVK